MPTYEYDFDPNGTSVDNKIVGETHVISPPDSTDFYFVVPDHAPFFLNNLSITHYPSGNTLVEGVDYGLSYKFLTASYQTAKSIFGAISIFNKTLSGTLEITYQTLGGKWAIDETKAAELVSNAIHNPRITSWELVVDLPETFPAIEHSHDLSDLVGMSEVVTQLEAIKTALENQTQTETNITQLQADVNNLQTDVSNLQSNLAAHKTSNDHDGRYYTQTEVDTLIANAIDGVEITYLPKNNRIATNGMQINVNDRVIVDTNSAALSMIAPLGPSVGDVFSVYDFGGNLSNNTAAIDRNGENIMGFAQDVELDMDNAQFHFEYRGTTKGWRIT